MVISIYEHGYIQQMELSQQNSDLARQMQGNIPLFTGIIFQHKQVNSQQ